jgi:hypothetical protein
VGVTIGVGIGVGAGVGDSAGVGDGAARILARVAHRRTEPTAALIWPARIEARTRDVRSFEMVRPRATVPVVVEVTLGRLRIRDPRLEHDPA